MNHWQRWLLAALVVIALAPALPLIAAGGQDSLAADGTIYVDAGAAGANNGTSWADAFTTLQPALDGAVIGDQIWVAAGIYTPTYLFSPGNPRSATFQLKNGVALYGGFDPTVGDTGWEDRDWVGNVTILSGDIGSQGDPADNSYHVFYHPSELVLDGSAVLDGFTVSGGNANGGSDRNVGGGMHNIGSSPTLTNCTFLGNSAYTGAGMYNYSSSSPAVTNCTFSDNSADGLGGGMYNHNSSPAVTNCTFSGNSAYIGGGMHNYASSPVVANCTFSGNSSGTAGGGMYNSDSSPSVINCTFSGNSADHGSGGMHNVGSSPSVTDCTFSGNLGGGMANHESSSPAVVNCTFSGNSGHGMFNHILSSPAVTNCTFSGNSYYGIYNYSSTPAVTNCILWGDGPDEIYNSGGSEPAVAYSDIQGGYDGTGNIDADPLFVDPGSGDYHLSPGSPCIDAGTNAAPNLPDFDFEGDPRVMDGDGDGTAIVDMGGDETWGNVILVDRDAAGDNNGSSWEDAYTDLQDALEDAADGDKVWVAAGIYAPTHRFDPGDSRSATFQLINGVALYGGFDPSVGDVGWEDRDWVNNVTILSGDIGIAGDPSDNSYHVFYHPLELALDGSAILDGFTVSGGNADADWPHYSGGGIFNDGASPAVTNCTFANNSANQRGGGIYNFFASPKVTNCTFSGNSASLGGGMHNYDLSFPEVTNCTFSGNEASEGGGIYNYHSSPMLTNCILWGDSPDELVNTGDEEPVVAYSDIQGSYDGTGNIDADPLFAHPGSGDYHLGPGSPCIDAGTNDAPHVPDFDFEGDPRIMDGDRDGTAIVDMGVDEVYGYALYLPLVFRVY
jgi:Right handed beta helix region